MKEEEEKKKGPWSFHVLTFKHVLYFHDKKIGLTVHIFTSKTYLLDDETIYLYV